MKFRSLVVIMLAACLVMQAPGAFAKSRIMRVGEWLKSKTTSTTVRGSIDNIEGRKISFKTVDGQILQLTGRKAERLAEHKGATLQVFGNVRKPDSKYPTGGIDVRNFRVVEEARPAPEPVSAPEPTAGPEPEPEPIAVPEPMAPPEPAPVEEHPAPEPEPIVTESGPIPGETDVGEKSSQEATYTVVKGDTLAKISKAMLGTTKRWKEIASANGITNPSKLKVGMVLKIPQ
ncbi:LysM peptidoglycan-binding domain-containing protein [bacterium]|nr:LysM peptidoglycan-binding domain-containing protein [bacterium]